MSADIIQFIRGPKHDREPSDFPTIGFRSAKRPDDLVMDHADTASSGNVPPIVKPGSDELAATEA